MRFRMIYYANNSVVLAHTRWKGKTYDNQTGRLERAHTLSRHCIRNKRIYTNKNQQ